MLVRATVDLVWCLEGFSLNRPIQKMMVLSALACLYVNVCICLSVCTVC